MTSHTCDRVVRVPESVAVLLRPEPHVGLRESLWKLRSAAIRFQGRVSISATSRIRGVDAR
jgi:hypothetical protein